MKIFYKSQVIINSVVYCCLSVVFLLIQSAIVIDSSLLNIKFLLEYFILGLPIVILALLTTQQLLKYKKYSNKMFITLVVTVVLVTSKNLIVEFDKLILLTLFFYTLIAYYFYQFIDSDLNESYVSPNYSIFRLFEPRGINIRLTKLNGKDVIEGLLTNWSVSGGFIYFSDVINIAPREKIKLELNFNNTTFLCQGYVVSMAVAKNGIGFKITEINEHKDKLNWLDFNTLTNIMGLDPKKVI